MPQQDQILGAAEYRDEAARRRVTLRNTIDGSTMVTDQKNAHEVLLKRLTLRCMDCAFCVPAVEAFASHIGKHFREVKERAVEHQDAKPFRFISEQGERPRPFWGCGGCSFVSERRAKVENHILYVRFQDVMHDEPRSRIVNLFEMVRSPESQEVFA